MAAGGFKEFVAGETLDEDDINDFLMQGVLVFAGTAARGSAMPSPVEGQFTFRTDDDVLEFFDGTDFVELVTGVEFNFLVIGGGGAGGNSGGAGGGAGGYRCSVTGENSGGGVSAEAPISLESGSYRVTVGAGGPGKTNAGPGNNGSPSIFAPIVSVGGGGGGNSANLGQIGGSGGGRGDGFGNAGAGVAGQGFAGGPANNGGGGGAGEAGDTDGSGHGGDGVASSITGSSVTRGGGGAGVGGVAGDGGGGAASTAGDVNTGGGGGFFSGAGAGSGAGGSGLVVIKYADNISLTIGAGLTSTTATAGGFKTTTFTAGTDTVSF